MATSRESYAIKHRWWGKTIIQKIKNIVFLFKEVYKRKYVRKLFIKDNFLTPYYKKIGCRYFNEHTLFKDDDSDAGWCTRCGKWFDDYDGTLRTIKLKKIIKKSK